MSSSWDEPPAFQSSVSLHGVELWAFSVRVLVLESKFWGQNDSREVKFDQNAGKFVIYKFWPITRNITRWLFLLVSHWFINVFDGPGFLLIRRSLVRAQVEEPPKKASSKAMFFPFIRHYLSRWGPLGDFLPSKFIELLHVYYTADGSSQGVFVTNWTPPPTCMAALVSWKWLLKSHENAFAIHKRFAVVRKQMCKHRFFKIKTFSRN